MKLKYLTLLAAAATFMTAGAHTVLLNENFNGDYTENFPVMIEGDHLQPANNIQSIFMDGNGVMRPWRMAKDIATSSDGYIVSHSLYNPAGKSNDWLCSRALNVSDEHFELSFDAKSLGFRAQPQKSTLWVFITEKPVVSEDDLPTEPTWVIEDMPLGDDPYNSIGYFTHYEYSLAEWAGKTIYLNFANLNENRDLLAIDNVLIQRLDPAELSVKSEPLLLKGEHTLSAIIAGTMGEGLKNWKLEAKFSNGESFKAEGATLAVGENKEFQIPFTVSAGELLGYTVTVTSDNAAPIEAEGEIRGLAFMPTHRVLMEEATGLWCGNCPMGQFTIESMMLDPEMNDKVIPVSVHISSSAHANHLVVNDYATQLGMNIAPAFRLDREFTAMTFSNVLDTKYDPNDEESVAGTIRKRASELTIMDIEVSGEFIVNGNDTTGIRATAKVIPAYTQDKGKEFTVGFILTENNVWLANNGSWAQENYLSGVTSLPSEVGGWVKLPKIVTNVRLQDVARAIYGYTGIDKSLPSEMKMSEEYTFTRDLSIPDTYKESNGTVTAPAIVAGNCGVVAFIIDRATNTVVNSAFYPMTELTEKRFTTADLLASISGVDEIDGTDDATTEAQYFTIDGLRVLEPVNGQLYIKRQGSKATKVIL